MSLIEDIKTDLRELDRSQKALRKFGLVVGIVFVAGALIADYLEWHPNIIYIAGSFGALLIIAGVIQPRLLKPVYFFWMLIAFVLGWIISKLILTILFYLIITPAGLLASLFGKQFIDKKIDKGSESYWIRNTDGKTDFEKMH